MSISDECPSEQELIEYCDGRLTARRVDGIHLHISECPLCAKAEQWIREHLLKPGTDDDASEVGVDRNSELASAAMDSTKLFPNQGRLVEESNIDHSLFSKSQDADALGRLGKYDIFRMLGQGGMGVVLQAHNEQLRRDVAIKMLNRSLSASTVARRRFIREARAAAAINHPNVVIIHDVVEHHGVPFIVMEMLTGRTLRDEIRRVTKIDPIRVIRLSAQIALGLASAHAQGVIHRDIKPGNIMLEDDVDRIKITDFGLARAAIDNIELTSRELAVGTPAYMSPEQVSGDHVDARSDLFAFGCVMHAMLTGHSPFQGRNALEMARKVETHEPPNLHTLNRAIPKFLAEIVEKLLKKDPSHRFQSAAEVADVLNRHLAILNQTPSDQMGQILQTTSLAKDAERGRTLLPRLAVAGVLCLTIMLALFANPGLRPQLFAPPRIGPDAKETRADPLKDKANRDRPDPDGSPKAAPAPRELTVAASGDADYRSIGEALAAASSGTTIRILDDATYHEGITIGGRRQQGVTLIGERRATLSVPIDSQKIEQHTLTLANAHNVRVQGLAVSCAGPGHAVLISGSAGGVVLEDLHCTNIADDSAHATVQVFVSIATPEDQPLQIRHCKIINQGATQCIWLHRPAHHVVITHNSFSTGGTGISLWECCQRLDITHNLFLDGPIGVSVGVEEMRTGGHLRFSNNSLLSSRSWFSFPPSFIDRQSVEIINNLIVGTQNMGIDRELQLRIVEQWKVAGNHWERGNLTDPQAGQAGAIAEMHDPATLEFERAADAVDFMTPYPGSQLLTAGYGGEFPAYVGAKDRVTLDSPTAQYR